MIKKEINLLVLLFLFIFSAGAVSAANIKTENSVYISPTETITGNLFTAGKTITVDGTISGDLITIAQNININGHIDGDIIALVSQNININGTVGGNVRVAGNSIAINGKILRNLNAFSTNILIGKTAKIGWDALLASSNAEIRGEINGNLDGHFERLLIAGKIKNINIILPKNSIKQSLTISPAANISGNLIYSTNNTLKINPKNIKGEIIKKNPSGKNTGWFLPWLWNRVLAIFSALIAGLILIFPLKKLTKKVLNTIEKKPLNLFLPGLAISFALPPIAVILTLTIIGIPVAIATIFIWLILLYFSKLFVALFLGKLIINKFNKNKKTSLLWSLVLGVSICWLLFSVPFIGWILSLITIWIGLGGLWLYVTNKS